MAELPSRSLERISEEDIRQLIVDISGNVRDEVEERDAVPSVDEIKKQLAVEQEIIDAELRDKAPALVITDGGVHRVHLPSCYHVRHVIDREQAWGHVLEGYRSRSDLALVNRMPRILNRDEVEALNSYVTCQACSPTLNHIKKVWRLNRWKPMRSSSFGMHHIGREIFTPDEEPLGTLISHQRTITAEGVQSLTVTSSTRLEGDGSEMYIVAPRE